MHIVYDDKPLIFTFYLKGEGMLKECDNSIYKGSFYKHKKHGEGTQVSRYENGDEVVMVFLIIYAVIRC